MSVDNPGVETVAEPSAAELLKEGKDVQDVRARPHRNGRGPHLVGPEVGNDGPTPPTIVDEPDHRHLPDGEPNRAKAIILGVTYLAAGSFGIAIGILMLKDAFKSGGEGK